VPCHPRRPQNPVRFQPKTKFLSHRSWVLKIRSSDAESTPDDPLPFQSGKQWSKCRHAWYFSFKLRGGPRYRFSLDAELEGHIGSKTDAENAATKIRAAILAGTFRRAMVATAPAWGYTRIQGALANLHHRVSRGQVTPRQQAQSWVSRCNPDVP